jgi:hypothetical protein
MQRTLAAGGEVRSWAEVWTHERELPVPVRKGRRRQPARRPRSRRSQGLVDRAIVGG